MQREAGHKSARKEAGHQRSLVHSEHYELGLVYLLSCRMREWEVLGTVSEANVQTSADGKS